MRFEIEKSSSVNKTFRLLNDVEGLTLFGLRQAWFASGKDLRKSANTAILKKPRKGRVYIIRGPSGRRRRHVASLPGESHANMTGALRRSMNWKVRGRDLEFGYGIVRRAPKYARWVEDGTKRMDARPSLQNSIDENERNISQHMADQVAKEFKLK